jgi:23S rRNA pseudouridine2605 synthase
MSLFLKQTVGGAKRLCGRAAAAVTADRPPPPPPPSVLMLHKPKGYITTRSDERNRKTVYSLLPEFAMRDRWMPAGRLDKDSRGLLLFVKLPRQEGGGDQQSTSRSGRLGALDLMAALTRPQHLEKVYEVTVRGVVTPDHIQQALLGVSTPVGLCKAVAVGILGGAGPKTRLRVVLDAGKNRHIRRLFGGLLDPMHGTPLKVVSLRRTSVGGLALGELVSGQWRFVESTELESAGLLLSPQ